MNRKIALLFTLIVALGVLYISPGFFGLAIYRQPSSSMEPGISQGDYIVVSYRAYADRSPEKHDIVAFESNDGRARIGRIVALPGEHVEVIGSAAYVDGVRQLEPFADLGAFDSIDTRYNDVDVEPAHFFIMGDNRNYSFDSRYQGAISANKIVGKVVNKF